MSVLLSAWEYLAFVRVLSKNIIQYPIFLWKSAKSRKQEFETRDLNAHIKNTQTNEYLLSSSTGRNIDIRQAYWLVG